VRFSETMYNSDIPSRAELPSTRQLIRSTVIAAVSAVALLYTVVLPSEYGVDPTGIGRALGLTEMGEIKTRLAQEAEEDAAATQASHSAAAARQAGVATRQRLPVAAPAASTLPGAVGPAAPAGACRLARRDHLHADPGPGHRDQAAHEGRRKGLYSWTVQGGVVNYDTHGDAIGRSISYVKGRGLWPPTKANWWQPSLATTAGSGATGARPMSPWCSIPVGPTATSSG
jgi:hypothetical protein